METKSFIMKLNYILITITVLLVFGNTINNGYNYDDELVTRNNKLTKKESSATIKDIFSSSYHEEYGYSYGYRPITTLSFYIEHRLFNESAKVSHIINLMLYLASVLLLYYLLVKIFTSINPYILLFICLLFAVHSVHSEVVSSIKNRDEILSFLFLQLTVLFSLKWFNQERLYFLLFILITVLFSILSKKGSVTILAVLPILFLFRFKLRTYNFWLYSLCYSIPLSIFLFNFDYINGGIVLIATQLVYLLIYFISSRNEVIDFIKGSGNLFKILPLAISILCLVVGVLNREVIFWLLGILTIAYYLKSYFTYTIALISLLSIAGCLILDSKVLIELPIFLIPGLYFTSISKLKNNWTVNISLCIILIMTAYTRSDWAYFFIFLIPLVVFITSYINKFIPLLISMVSLIICITQNQVSIFQFGLVLFSLLPLFSQTKLIYIRILSTFTWLLAILFVTGFSHFNSSGSLLQTIEQKQEMANQFVENQSTSLQEGRQLEYMENTLVAPHTLEQRIATGAVVLGEYFRLMMFPKELSFYYGYSKIATADFTNYMVWVSLLIHLSLVFLMIYAIDKQPLVSFGILWYLVAILLFSNWPVLVAGMVGERLAFIASLGFAIAVGGVLNWINPNFNFKKPKGIEFIVIAVLFIFSGRTIARNKEWKNSKALMSHDIQHLESSAHANYMYAMELIKGVVENTRPNSDSKAQLSLSIHHFKKAIEIYPDFYNYQFDLGRAYIVIEDYQKAKEAFYQAYLLEPNALFSLDELVKTSFDLKQYDEAVKYGLLYLEQNNANSLIYELTAYSAFLNGSFQLSKKLTIEGIALFPQNQNLKGLLIDINNKTSE